MEKGFGWECYRLLGVVDGDTVTILYHHRREKVRLLGIDAPESRVNRRALYQERRYHRSLEEILYFGELAKEHLQKLLAGTRRVCLLYDRRNFRRDRYRRLLGYLFTPGGLFLNRKMLEDGLAYPLTRYPLEKRYRQIFWRAVQRAKREKRGIWKGGIGWEGGRYSSFSREGPRHYLSSMERGDRGGSSHYWCGRKRYCYQMDSCREAYYYYRVCGVKRLDGDRDGVPCENLCRGR